MWLERRLVIELDKVKNKGNLLTRVDYLLWFCDKKWPRLNYILEARGNDYVRKVDSVLGDCIGGKFPYVGYSDELPSMKGVQPHILVTREGRDFIRTVLGIPYGLLNEFLKRYDKFTVFIFGAGGTAFIWLIKYLWSNFHIFG